MHSPPTIVRHIVRPKSAEPPRSPLLKRVQSEEKLAPSYGTDKKHLCSRKHSLEVTQEEVNREVSPRDVTLQSLEENVLDAPSFTRVRPAEQGCLKRPVSRKLGRQESVDELDREKLKVKIVVKKQDLAEKQEYLQKVSSMHEPFGESENSVTSCLEEKEGKKTFQKALERSNHSETKITALETQSVGGMLKDTLQKNANMRSNDYAASDVHAPCHGPPLNEFSHLSCDFKRISPPCTLQDVLLQSSDKMLNGKGENADKTAPVKEFVKCERLDSKLANIDYLRKKMSFEEKDDSPCPVLKSKLASNIHECHQLSAVRPMNIQQDSSSSSDSWSYLSSAHSAQIGSVSFVPLKALNSRADSSIEKPALISTESPVRKSPSEYKLEGRSVSCLKPIEGTLDIALLSGPQASKISSEVSSGAFPGGQSAKNEAGCPIVSMCQNGSSVKAEPNYQKEQPPASQQSSRSHKSDVLELQSSRPSKNIQNSLAGAVAAEQTLEKTACNLSTKSDSPLIVTNQKKDAAQFTASEAKSSSVQSQDAVLTACKSYIAQSVTEKPKRREKKATKEVADNQIQAQRSEDMHSKKPETTENSTAKRPGTEGLPHQDPKNIPRCSFDSSLPLQTLGTTKVQVVSSKAKAKDVLKQHAKEDDNITKQTSGNELGMQKASAHFRSEASLPPKSLQTLADTNSAKKEEPLPGVAVQKDTPRELGTKEQKQSKNALPPAMAPAGDKEPSVASRQQGSNSDAPNVKESVNRPSVVPACYTNQDNLRSASCIENSSVKSRHVPDSCSSKSKHSDKLALTQKQTTTNLREKETSAQVLAGSRREGKNISKTAPDSFSNPSSSQRKLNNEHIPVERHLVIECRSEPSILINSSMPEKQLKSFNNSHAAAAATPENTKHFQRQEMASLSDPLDQKPLHVRSKQTVPPKVAAVKDSPLPSKHVDKGLSHSAAEKQAEGKKCTDALYFQNDSGNLDSCLSSTGGDTRGKMAEKSVTGIKNSPDVKGKGHSNQKQSAEGSKQHAAKHSSLAALQHPCRPATAVNRQHDCPSSFLECRQEALVLPLAKAKLGSAEAVAVSCREVKRQASSSSAEGRAEMTKSISVLGLHSVASPVEEHAPTTNLRGKPRSQERPHSANTAVDIKGRDPILPQSSAARKQNVGKDLPKSGTPADSLHALSSDKDSARQRRGKDASRSSPHKKTS